MNNTEEDLQNKNRNWWDQNPMNYDWDKTLEVEEGTKEFFCAIDDRFFNALRIFAHPLYPNQAPFSQLINYNELKGKRVLEIGCGLGGNAAIIAKSSADFYAIDITPKAIELCKKRFQLFGFHGNIEQGDAEKLKFEDDYFDFIWSWGE